MALADPDGAGRRARLVRRTALLAAVAVLLVLATLLLLVPRGPTETPPAGTTGSAATPTGPPPGTPQPSLPAGDLVLFDDFSDGELDVDRWDGGSDSRPLIGAAAGAAVLDAPPQQNPDGDSATVRARLSGPLRDLRFRMTLQELDGGNDGGAYVVVSSEGSRRHKVIIGPNGDGGATMGFDVCERPDGCDDADFQTFAHPVGVPDVVLGQAYEVGVTSSGGSWLFTVDGEQRALAPQEPGPIEAVELYLYSFGDGTFRAAVDDVRVTYAE
jgi:hypothetical protein